MAISFTVLAFATSYSIDRLFKGEDDLYQRIEALEEDMRMQQAR